MSVPHVEVLGIRVIHMILAVPIIRPDIRCPRARAWHDIDFIQ